MRVLLLSVVVAIRVFGAAYAGVISAQGAREDADGSTLWYDGTGLPIEGRAFCDTESYYDRLPARAKETVPTAVWKLSHYSSGMALHFVTDAG